MRLALACLLLSGCVSPLAPLRWDPLPDLPTWTLPPIPQDDAWSVMRGDVSTGTGLALPAPAFLALEDRAFAFADAVEALEAERAAREADRIAASEAFAAAVEACRRRQRAACAVCAALGAVAGTLPGAGLAAGACR